ncbi:MAG: hypothetical protein LBH90_07025 [Tannerella sp.]|jgi:hypothetical protein|nr:hypothetical protein [Tannerella sp.]
MKRLFSILIITAAVMSLQISTIVPHYHHGNTVCIVLNYGEHECDGGNCSPDCSANRHNHDGDENRVSDSDCITKTSYIVSEQSEIRHNSSHDGHDFNFDYVLMYLELHCTEARLVHTKHRHREKPFLCKSATVSRINGLRAPPYSIA